MNRGGRCWLETADYDDWKTTPPEPEESNCRCCTCRANLYEDDEYYELDDEIYCEECAFKWLDSHKNYVSEAMVKGE